MANLESGNSVKKLDYRIKNNKNLLKKYCQDDKGCVKIFPICWLKFW